MKKIKKVVALEYDGQSAPKVTAKGSGEIANRILALAKEHDIPLYQDENLSYLLSKVNLGEEIPENLYVAVAKVLAFIFSMDNPQKKTKAAKD